MTVGPGRLHREGYLVADMVIALTLVGVLLGVITAAQVRHRQGLETLADQRAATRLAETTLSALQAGESKPATPANATIEIEPGVEAEAPVKGRRWVTVRVTLNDQHAELVGLVPRSDE